APSTARERTGPPHLARLLGALACLGLAPACGSEAPSAAPAPAEPAAAPAAERPASPGAAEPFAKPVLTPPPPPAGATVLPDRKQPLYVQRCDPDHPCPDLLQPAGETHCRQLDLGGLTGWRLPD